MAQKARYTDPAQRRLYPLSTFNSWCARPLSRALAPVMTPNQVSLLSLAVSVAGLVLVAQGPWRTAVVGALAVHLGLLLDHADGQVARRRGMGSTWGMYLDMVIDRIVEIGIVLALLGATWAAPDWITSWSPLSAGRVAWIAVATVGAMMLWRFLNAYNDVLYLRSHLLSAGRLPDPEARPKGVAKRPLVPWVFNRDWVLMIWLVGVALTQLQATLLLLFGLHVLSCLEKIIVFRVRHKHPEGDATRVLGKDYH